MSRAPAPRPDARGSGRLLRLGLTGLAVLSLAVAAGVVLPTAQADGPLPEQLFVRIVPVKGAGLLRDGDTPALPPELRGLQPLLADLSYDHYFAVGAAAGASGRAGTDLTATGLPLGYASALRWRPEGARVVLSMTVTRPPDVPDEARVEVAGLKLSLPDGGHCLLVCKDAYPDGDLLLLVSVRTRPFAGATTERAAARD